MSVHLYEFVPLYMRVCLCESMSVHLCICVSVSLCPVQLTHIHFYLSHPPASQTLCTPISASAACLWWVSPVCWRFTRRWTSATEPLSACSSCTGHGGRAAHDRVTHIYSTTTASESHARTHLVPLSQAALTLAVDRNQADHGPSSIMEARRRRWINNWVQLHLSLNLKLSVAA